MKKKSFPTKVFSRKIRKLEWRKIIVKSTHFHLPSFWGTLANGLSIFKDLRHPIRWFHDSRDYFTQGAFDSSLVCNSLTSRKILKFLCSLDSFGKLVVNNEGVLFTLHFLVAAWKSPMVEGSLNQHCLGEILWNSILSSFL